MNIGLQMFSLRSKTKEDFVGTLRRVAEVGYDGIEFAGYGNLSSDDMKRYLKEFNLKAAGSHMAMDTIKENFDSIIKYCTNIGLESLVVPGAKFDSYDDWMEFTEDLNVYGKKFHENGMIFGYHNHSHEFKKINDKYIIDIVFENVDPKYVFCEFDTHWISKGGEIPEKFISKYSGRCPLLHAKDVSLDGVGDTEVGSGSINFKEVIKSAGNVKWVIVEQEKYSIDPFDSIEKSLKYLKLLDI